MRHYSSGQWKSCGVCIFHFPIAIFHLPSPMAAANSAMANEKWQLENGK
jgi:hypothetical protein